ncbi:MAG: pyridoxamine 5'-phosphate oxidase family protein [Brevundimonas sp.]|uniref:pyridoxamine 5'-phosphate oxidase family protein n=1 Tax=Brevundimonas sp. TaxID=1871086 RepID=UPI0024894F39|nr:pyridoxamine 5'-phosphate oxidase family protein [Brevundimonas sp.]MDI1326155.1 pyridoxamine 5'-phosphate oxidase family protein [Brevundimonas sp.]
MTDPAPPPIHERAVEAIAGLLSRERLMSVALNNPDGWPQVTTVGYLNEGLNLYFIVARSSRKVANAGRDPRAGVAIRSESNSHGDAVGVSMSGRVREVLDPSTIERLNRQVIARYPDVHVYCPGGDAVAVLHFTPEIVSCVGVIDGRSETQTFSIADHPASGGGESRLF